MQTVKLNSDCPDVIFLQSSLGLKPDGVYGPKTERVVKEFQKNNNLGSDGIVGPKTWSAILQAHPKSKIEESDYISAAKFLGCDVASIKALREVECGSNPFFSDGSPAILFEAHKFYAELGKVRAEKEMIKHPNIISRKWNKTLYKGGLKEYDRLREAWTVDRAKSLRSASFGGFQICGFNCSCCGYSNVYSFVAEMWKGEKEQLKAFVEFVFDCDISDYLKKHDWKMVARLYNGSGQVDEYAKRLLTAYNKYNK